ncbi:MAG: 50S ribosomal protein L3 [Patescibacteria group bacterium]|jgi:large subunit ribosomal protein L3|nr:50S ribosomal protein L3 [Patescibacteria group bacterium]
MKFILGKKMGMTQVWVENKVIGVTPVKAGPCTITQIKNTEKDGYNAVQLAFGERKEKNIKKPQIGHFKKAAVKPTHVKEFRLKEAMDLNIGDTITANTFKEKDTVAVTGTSKGKGFQGVIKRHGFHGFKATHGNKDQERMPGSIGSTAPAHVFKGMKMGGRMGDSQITTSNLEVVSVDEENDVIFVKGALPGAMNSLVMLKGEGELEVNTKKTEEVKEEPKKEKNTEKEEDKK